MQLSPLKREIYAFFDRSEFIPAAEIQEITQRIEAAGEDMTILSYALEKFRNGTCPRCDATGAYRWHFLGKRIHPNCTSWYIGPGEYAGEQFGSVFRSGMSAAAEIGADAEKKGDKAGGCVGAIFGFLFVGIFRLIFAVLMIPIQAIVSLSQKKVGRSPATSE